MTYEDRRDTGVNQDQGFNDKQGFVYGGGGVGVCVLGGGSHGRVNAIVLLDMGSRTHVSGLNPPAGGFVFVLVTLHSVTIW